MKDQYFGDINDYRKYGLLRILQSKGGSKLLVAWMLTPNDVRNDGNNRAYLKEPKKWKPYDPNLFDGLVELLHDQEPKVELIEGTPLLPDANYYSKIVPDNRLEREKRFECLLGDASKADLVFVDPDNGIEVPSKPLGRKDSSKYIYWGEIEAIWQQKCSILIYQHFPRKPRDLFTQQILCELKKRTSSPFVSAFRTAHVVFLLVAQKKHAEFYRSLVARFPAHWTGQITVVPEDENILHKT
jgi:hypothetical protein